MATGLRRALSTVAYDRATTILCVRRGSQVVMMGDGQVSRGSTIVKPNARKVRTLADGRVLCGFAGATADALTLLERLESQLEQHSGQLLRASVEVAKAWRTDKYLRRLEALIVVADKDVSLTISGVGDVLEPHDGLIGIGSGGDYALAAARALIDIPDLSAAEIARRSMRIAAGICVYTNDMFVEETLEATAA
ncbi:ATP-dependent protease subunit HslV [Plasmodiophora brassicae]|uniref:ATP-dependent protease subunit HslV n=1 Tax=Plasmodiophora brassicae TaxID=37360 RepID=A0A0G4J5N0_PLABS|nr:hypothetical protein PBRA_002881 [Plasmodiophora brassicae]SPQ95017.1 unnamed protein product [Plasmodiophora brassicae]